MHLTQNIKNYKYILYLKYYYLYKLQKNIIIKIIN